MLAHAAEMPGTPSEAIPLFLDPMTGEELTYAYAAIQLRSRLIRCGYEALARGSHGLRIGGASEYARLGGQLSARQMGRWVGDSEYLYQWGFRDELEAIGVTVGRSRGGTLAERAGPAAARF
jgi:hypothetical protein